MRNKRMNKVISLPRGIATGVILSVAILLAGVSVCAYLILNGKVEMSNYLVLIMLALSVFIGVYVSGKLVQQKYAVVGLIESAIVFVLLLGIHIFFAEGQFRGVPGIIGGICMGAVGGCMPNVFPKKGRVKKRNR